MTCCCEARALTGGGAYVQTDIVQAGGRLYLRSCISLRGKGGGFHVAGSFTQTAGHAHFSSCRAAHGGCMSVGGAVSVASQFPKLPCSPAHCVCTVPYLMEPTEVVVLIFREAASSNMAAG